MGLRFLIDECSISAALLNAIDQYASDGDLPIDYVCVGDADAPAYSTQDPDLIEWAILHDRAIVSYDTSTLIRHYREALEHTPPPLLIRRKEADVADIAEFLVLAAHVLGRDEYGQIIWFP